MNTRGYTVNMSHRLNGSFTLKAYTFHSATVDQEHQSIYVFPFQACTTIAGCLDSLSQPSLCKSTAAESLKVTQFIFTVCTQHTPDCINKCTSEICREQSTQSRLAKLSIKEAKGTTSIRKGILPEPHRH